MPDTYQTNVWKPSASQYTQEWFERNVGQWLDEKVAEGYVLHSIKETDISNTAFIVIRATVELKHLRYR